MKSNLKLLLVVAGVGLLAAACNSGSNSNTSQPDQSSNQPSNSQQSAAPSFQQITPGQQHVITYTDSGFSPKTLTIKKGDTVAFENTASDDVRVASNPHPTHEGYPTTGGCVSSTFDSCGNIPSGQMWTFTFDIAGSWGYHNHLNPSEGGTIVVQK